MKNIVLIIGARPNFMKAFPVYQALKNDFNLTLIHTGQHFDEKMSKVFFEQLKFPYPDIHLTLDKRTKAGDFDDKLYINNVEYLKNKDQVIMDLIEYKGELGQMGEIRDKLKKEFEHLKPDLVIVFGDVTSTLAAGLSSKMLNIDIAHVESGLRSGDIRMPEEVNRILTDHITKFYFVTEQSGVDNLNANGITENVYLVGNTMIDTQKKYLQQALNTKYNETLGVKAKEYVLITLHRPSNVDDMDKLREIFDDLEKLSKPNKLVYPIHPRTKKNLKKIGYLEKVENNKNIILQDPLGYLEFTCLMANCKYVVTDSGGLQEETTALDIPCFTLRENTERPSTLIENNGTNQMINKISEFELKPCKGSMDLWDGKSSVKIYEKIYNTFNESLLVDKKYIMNTFQINGRQIGKGNKTYIIAELSANHNQNYDNAIKLIDAAHYAGADAVKLQTYRADTITIDCDKEDFQIKGGTLWDGQTLYELYKIAYTPWEWHKDLKEYANNLGMDLFSSPFDVTAVDYLENLDMPAYKIASCEITDHILIKKIAQTGKPVIISSGNASIQDLQEAVDVLRQNGCTQICMLKCTAAYPAKKEDANLLTIKDMMEKFNVIGGLSDHTLGIEVPTISVAMGASVIEKHFTLSRDSGSPDDAFSLTPDEFKKMVESVRLTESIVGNITYGGVLSEKETKKLRRSLFIVKDMKKGEKFTEDNLKSIRPGNGLHTKHYWDILGKECNQDIKFGTPMTFEFLDNL